MAQAPRIGGTTYFKLDGEQLSLKGSFECPLSTKNRESVMDTAGGVAGFNEKFKPPYVKGTFIFTPGFPIAKVVDSTDLTLTVELANGKTYVLSGAFLVGDAPVKGDEGEVDLEFNGVKGDWQ